MDLKHELTEKERKQRLNDILKNTKVETECHHHPAYRYPFLVGGKRWDPLKHKKDETIFQERLNKIRNMYRK